MTLSEWHMLECESESDKEKLSCTFSYRGAEYFSKRTTDVADEGMAWQGFMCYDENVSNLILEIGKIKKHAALHSVT